MALYPDPVVSWFKVWCFEFVLRDAALVRSPAGKEFSARIWERYQLNKLGLLLICSFNPLQHDLLTEFHS